MNSLLESALGYADRGWKVLPLHGIKDGRCTCGYDCKAPGKHPIASLVPHGLQDATDDPEILESWFGKVPGRNIGVRTGKDSGLWVVDVDSKKSLEVAPGILIPEGESSIRKAEEENLQRLPDTLTATTGSGGRHYLYEYPEGEEVLGNRAGFLPSVDIRGEGGYIVVSPSRHLSGGLYSWDDPTEPVSSFPKWFSDLGKKDGESFQELSSVPEGGRNDYLYRYGASLIAKGRDFQEVVNAVLGANLALCKPPLDLSEVERVVQSLGSLEKPLPEVQVDLEAFKKGKGDEIPELEEGDTLGISLLDLIQNPPPPTEPIIHSGILDHGDGFILAGQPNIGKSWIAFDLALSVASGRKWLGEFKTEQGGVLIVDEEGSLRALHDRMSMLLRGRGIDPGIPVSMVVQKGIRLDTTKGIITLQRLVERHRPSVVILDSMVRFHSGEENSSRDISAFFRVSQELKNAYNCAIIFLHHVRKPMKDDPEGDPGNLIRGSGDIRGWPDGILVAVPESSQLSSSPGMVIHHVKSRNHAKQEPFKVSLWVDEETREAQVKFLGSVGAKPDHQKELDKVLKAVSENDNYGRGSVELSVLRKELEMEEVQILVCLNELMNLGKITQGRVYARDGRTFPAWSTTGVQEALEVWDGE